jgi:hypothetical protein
MTRSGLFYYARRALTEAPNPLRHASAEVQRTLDVLRDHREREGHSYASVSELLHSEGFHISETEYRALETGMTKHPQLDIILTLADRWRISPRTDSK